MAVVILPSLEGGQIDDFTNKLFAKWGVGQKGKNNGVMLLVAIGDRKARIEVGYGLEPILPDALAGRVLAKQLYPAFKQQRYAQGLTQAVSRIAAIVERGEPAPPEARQGEAPHGAWVMLALVLIVFAAFGFGVIGAGLRSRRVLPVVWGAIFGGVAMFLAFFTSGLAFSLLAVFAVVMLVVGWKTAHLAKPGTLARRTGRQVGIGVTSGTVAGLAAADLAAGASVAGAAGSAADAPAAAGPAAVGEALERN